MSSRCTTHFHACDCREEKFKLLEQRLREAEEVIGFYGDKKNWKICEQYKPWNNFSVIKDDLNEENANMTLWTVHAGKRARAYFEKYGEKEER